MPKNINTDLRLILDYRSRYTKEFEEPLPKVDDDDDDDQPTTRSKSYHKFLGENFTEGYELSDTSHGTIRLAPYRGGRNEEDPKAEFTSQTDKIAFVKLTDESIREETLRRANRHLTYNRAPVEAVTPETLGDCILPIVIHTKYEIETQQEDSEESKTVEIYSTYNKKLLEYFGSAIDLTNIDLPLRMNTYKEISGRESPYARNRRYQNWQHSEIILDTIGTFSFFGLHDQCILDIPKFLELAGNKPVKTIRLASLFRGGAGITTHEFANARASKLIRGKHIFPYLTKYEVLNQETREFEWKIFFCLGIFEDLKKIIKYVRSRNFFPALVEDLQEDDGLRIFDPPKYKELIKERFGENISYWNGIQEVFEKIPRNLDYVDKRTELTRIAKKGFTYLDKGLEIENEKESKEFNKLKQIHDDYLVKYSGLETSRHDALDQVGYASTTVQDYEARLASATKLLEEYQVKAEKAQKQIEGMLEAKDKLIVSYAEAKEKYTKFIDNKLVEIEDKDSTGIDYLANLEKTGIIVTDITYAALDDPDNRYTLDDDPKIAWDTKYSSTPKHSLHEVSFYTTKPLIIRVDANKYDDPNKCKKIVGGPYIVTVTKRSLSVRLATSSACFGVNKSSSHRAVMIHPHTPAQSMYRGSDWTSFKSTILDRSQNGCLGEALPTLHKAFDSNDPKAAIFAAMTWLTSANSADQWGKNWKFFPRLKDVNLDGVNTLIEEEPNDSGVENLLSSPEGMDQLAETVATLIESLPEAPEETGIATPPEPVVVPEPVAITVEERAEASPEYLVALVDNPTHGQANLTPEQLVRQNFAEDIANGVVPRPTGLEEAEREVYRRLREVGFPNYNRVYPHLTTPRPQQL